MFLVIGIVLLVVWILGFALFRAVAGGLIHIVLILAVIAIVWHVVSTRNHPAGTTTSAEVSGRPVPMLAAVA
jgi:uncharacterized membrane protein YqjE